jgi:hypothetical protein
MIIIINPGTEAKSGATEANAMIICDRICDDLEIDRATVFRQSAADDVAGGWFGFSFAKPNGDRFEVDIPGDDPDQVCEGRPFKSRRLYVDGSSWLYGYALNRIEERTKGE